MGGEVPVAAVAETETGIATDAPRSRTAERRLRRFMRIPRLLPVLAVSALGLALVAATCAPYQDVGIQSTPSEAEIFVDGELVGHTPKRLPITTLGDHKVYLKKEGYRPELVVLLLHRPLDRINFLTPPDIVVTLTPLSDSSLDSDLRIEIEEE